VLLAPLVVTAVAVLKVLLLWSIDVKKALVNSKQVVDGGWMIAQVCDEQFEVHPDLYWVDVADDVTDSVYYWDGSKAVLRADLNIPGTIPVFNSAEGGSQ
jgi:hypothetical protein